MAITFFWLTFLATCFYALLRGGAPERIGAGIFITGFVLTGLTVSSMAGQAYRSAELGVLAVDGAMLAAFLVLALRSQRFWPIWMSALQAVQVAGHLTKIAYPDLMPWAYGIAQALWSYPMMALLIAATWRHSRRMATHGADRSWRDYSLRSSQDLPPAGPMV